MPAWPAPTTTTPWPDVGCRFASPDAFILNRVPSRAVAKHPSFSPKLRREGCITARAHLHDRRDPRAGGRPHKLDDLDRRGLDVLIEP